VHHFADGDQRLKLAGSDIADRDVHGKFQRGATPLIDCCTALWSIIEPILRIQSTRNLRS
jgi:hypothetical protein